MSAIATFYLVRNEDVEQLKESAAQPVGPGPKGKWRDPYHELLVANARALKAFDWSGDVVSEVIFYLESRSIAVDDYSDRPLSENLSRVRGAIVHAFRAEPGRRLAELIEVPDEATLRAYLDSPQRASPEDDLAPEAVLDGLHTLKSWLSQIDERNMGLLTVG